MLHLFGVDLVQVDIVGLQPAQAGFASLADILPAEVAPGRAMRLAASKVFPNLVAMTTWSRSPRKDIAQQCLAVPDPIDIGGVEER
jgi:hypothetical protein